MDGHLDNLLQTPEGRIDDDVVVELLERLEIQAADIAALRRENDGLRWAAESVRADREALKTELALAQGWVRELASELEEADRLLQAALGDASRAA